MPEVESNESQEWVCPDCNIFLAFVKVQEVNQSNWDVHDGDIVSVYTCPACESDFLIDSEGDLVMPEYN